MHFASDNAGPVHPEVLDALTRANQGFAPGYGTDPLTIAVQDKLRDIFEAPNAAVHLVATGTAANALALACMAQPYDTVFCTPMAHINVDECNAPEFYTGGAKLTLVPGGDKMTPEALRATILKEGNRHVHGPRRGPVSLTQVAEFGAVYTLDEIRALTGIAREFGLKAHMDGARFTNALVALDCTPAEMTWKAGIDAVSFGGTKNGLMGVEAVIFFDPAASWEFELRRKRGGHLFSKNRYLAAQMSAYLSDDLWLRSARQANGYAARLAQGLRAAGATFQHQPDANMVFASFPRAAHQRLAEAGAFYYFPEDQLAGDPDEMIAVRLVCDWSIGNANVDRFIELVKG